MSRSTGNSATRAPRLRTTSSPACALDQRTFAIARAACAPSRAASSQKPPSSLGPSTNEARLSAANAPAMCVRVKPGQSAPITATLRKRARARANRSPRSPPPCAMRGRRAGHTAMRAATALSGRHAQHGSPTWVDDLLHRVRLQGAIDAPCLGARRSRPPGAACPPPRAAPWP